MSGLVRPAALRPRRWTADELWARKEWRMEAPEEVKADLPELRKWAMGRSDPIAECSLEDLRIPALRRLALRVRAELSDGSGAVWIRGVLPLSADERRLVFVALGMCLGTPVGAYGRLYDVRDKGLDYTRHAIPVSQTNAATGLHTDSSNRGVCPKFVGLLCLQPAREGGQTRIVSALEVHERLRLDAPLALRKLYAPHMRDVVTPGSPRTAAHVRANSFPVFACHPEPAFRYMRYWIERGQERAGEPLDPDRLEPLDRLDAALADPAYAVRFRLAAGDMLLLDNTTVAHDRDGYVSHRRRPRWLCRLWISGSRGPRGVPVG